MEAHIDSAHKGVEPIQYHCEVCNKGYMKKYRYVFKEIPTYLYLHFVNCFAFNFLFLFLFLVSRNVNRNIERKKEKKPEQKIQIYPTKNAKLVLIGNVNFVQLNLC